MAVTTRNGAFIGGEWVAGDGEEIEVRSPASGELLGSVRAATSPAQVDRAVGRPRRHSQSWRRTSLRRARRALPPGVRHLHGAQRGDRADDHARGRQDDPRGARGDGRVHLRPLPPRRRGHAAPRRPGAAVHAGARGPKRIMVVQEPVGVVAAVSPWNFPVDIAGIPVVYGLAVGCTVVWKPSEHAPLCASMFVEAARRRRLPGRHCQRRARARRHRLGARAAPGVASVVFTGSVETGEQVARDAGLQEPRARARRQRAADRARRRRPGEAPPTPRSSAASTSRASAAPPPSASSCTRSSKDASWRCCSSGRKA